MKVLGIIPARYDSSRFPGKPLVVIDGKTMIRRVYEQAKSCRQLDRVVVATDHEAILKHVKMSGGEAVMTSRHHTSGTERCNEAAGLLEASGERFDAIVNIQGDEPFIDPRQIAQVVSCLEDPAHEIATLVRATSSWDEIRSENVVKVVVDHSGKALLFSRAVIPFVRGKTPEQWPGEVTFYKHVGIYGYRTGVLNRIVGLPMTALEKAESLEQLRWLEYGYTIYTQVTEFESTAIDTPGDLLKITNTGGTKT
ncbi:MAG TPA: 3-deoxy-manno-octulosonate cytidylyltransferase [Bacteroidales bacterium]|nr:3-deoxy-manno-octulosonate cytidylyltransferase [Bacteroidales bacterium]HPS63100.1 3-deoxy-manno-octulosonate cytidylyltransferase [Bacteroidales bacterium]